MAKHPIDIIKIYLLASLSLFFLSLSFYYFGFKPLSERLRQEYAQQSAYFIDSGLWLLQGIFNKHSQISSQIASRTAIRKKQIAFLNQKITLQELKSFSTAKLEDAINASNLIIGIVRWAPDGKLLYRVGFTDLAGIEKYCADTSPDRVQFAGLITTDDRHVLAYCSPIRDSEYGLVGTDLLIMKDNSIQNVIDDHHLSKHGSLLLALTEGQTIIYWPQNIDNPRAKEALQRYSKGLLPENNYTFRARQLARADWRLIAVVNEKRFFADLDHQLLMLVMVISIITLVVFIFTILALKPVIRALLRQQSLYEKAHRDGLTGLYNYSRLLELLDRELGLAARHHNKISAVMFDIDHFKLVNDSYGHQAGDRVLEVASAEFQKMARAGDVCARYGGEEFIIILPQTDIAGATALAERLRKRIAETCISFNQKTISVTISLGAICCDMSRIDCNTQRLIKTVDEALYTSKRAGRNRTTSVSLP